MRVVLDASSIIKSSFYLTSPIFQTLFATTRRLPIELVFVDIVIAEVTNHAAQEFDTKRQKANAAIGEFSRAADYDVPTISAETQRNVVDQFQRRILATLDGAGARIRPHAEIEHRILVDRDIARKKPFGGSKSGYRDALIWFTVLEMLSEDDETLVFVTDNIKDFGAQGQDPTLHTDLIADLEQRGIPVDSVTLLRTVDEFFE